ncbi:hypothetical protein LO763_05135 [Glycomyces sp. A-F 0318]|uniref:hypothetical protein n=1 Tax=Glycomyces amatae TaxID=2881355 RepID=UPI001E6597F0|nr:hypothetical protein [Glycomyces amatae]MCD0443009.1 hypothetical protein [Glycomyces amatae]
MPRKSESGRRPDPLPFDLRSEVARSVLPPVLAVAAMATVLWLGLFLQDPLPPWARAVGAAAVAAPVVGAIASCFRGRSRRLWKPALAFPVAVIAAAAALVPAFERFALAHHGVDAECSVVSKRDYVKHLEDEDEPMTAHEFLCRGWGPVSLDTYRDEQLEPGEVRIVVFDPLGRVDPDFDDPDFGDGLLFIPLPLLFIAGGIAIRLFLVDDGTIATAVGAGFRRLRGRFAA